MNRTSRLREPRVGGGGQYNTYSAVPVGAVRRDNFKAGPHAIPSLRNSPKPRGKTL